MQKIVWIKTVFVLLLTCLPDVACPAAKPWRVVEQPELKDEFADAPILRSESLGEPARGVNVWERWLVPNHDGKSWDVLQIYFKEYYGPTWLYAIDLGTGQVTKQRLADGHQFYLSGRALGFDGKYYIATPFNRTWSMDLFVYDPETNTLEERGEIVHGLGGEVRPLVTGPDGRIYGTGTRDNRVGLYIYDPKLGKVGKDFGPVGPAHPNGAWSRYVMGVDDTHAYTASGMIPAWYLVAVNLTTGQEKIVLESPTECVKQWPDGQKIGTGETTVSLKPNADPLGGDPVFVEVPMSGFKPWTYEQPNLYSAKVLLTRGTRTLDEATVRFGMREITISDSDYFLNGKPLRFRGSNLVFEWDWGDTITGHEVIIWSPRHGR